MSFADRFEPTSGRTDLSFRGAIAPMRALKDEWAFVEHDALRSNIAATLQDVQFDVLLVNNYNVFWSPLAMKCKHAVVQAASVAEAVLQYMLEMIQEDERVQEILGKKWNWIDFNNVPLGGRIDVPDDKRVVSGIQQQVQNVLDRNTKMKLLIQAANKAEIIDDDFANELDELRDGRNRIHIKTLDAPEYEQYKPHTANTALDLLERFRIVAARWTTERRGQGQEQTVADQLASQVRTKVQRESQFSVGDPVHHSSFGVGVVIADEGGGIIQVDFRDAGVRRLWTQFAGLIKL